MATNISLSESNFFESKHIKVYPASFRGSYGANANNAKFDPEATLTTEYNITRPRIAGDRETYIISWDDSDRKLTCVIGGYYFEISGVDKNALSNKYLCIRKRTIDLTDEDRTDGKRTTSVLDSFTNNSVGVLDEIGEDNKYFFTGLLISDETAGDVATEFKLHAFLDGGAINCAEFIPNIRSGSGNNDSKPTSLVFGDGATATANRSVAIGDQAKAKGEHSFAFGNGASAEEGNSIAIGSRAKAQKLNSVAIGNEAIASGEHAVSIGNGTKATGVKSFASGSATTASGECSQASGNSTTASGVASVAEGHTTTASGECSHAGGKETQAIGACSAAFGDHTVAGHDNQFVIGAFNENKENNVFEIGKGTEGNQKNIFEVADNGDTTLNSLNASGDLGVTGTAKFGKDGKEALIVEENQVTVNPQAVFNGGAEIRGKLTVTTDNDLKVTGKLSTSADGTTISKQLKIQGDRNFVYDSATGSLAIGTHKKTGTGAMALTSGSDASGNDAFVIGTNNDVSEKGSAAFGTDNNVKGQYSFASGNGNAVSGHWSVAMGNGNLNEKNNAAVFGKGNVANSAGELVVGSYNELVENGPTEYFAIGNGTSEKRRTAFKVASTGADKPTEAYIDGKPIATHVMEDNTFRKSLLNLLYPIGSVYVYSGSRDRLNILTDNGNTWCECPIRQTLGGTWVPIEDHFLYAGNQAIQEATETTETTPYNALGHAGGSNEAYIVNHTHTITEANQLTTGKGLTNDLFIGVPTGDHGRATVWPDGSDNNNASDDEHNKWTDGTKGYGTDLNTVGKEAGQGVITVTHEDKTNNGYSKFGQMMDMDGNMHENDLMANYYRKPTVIHFDLKHTHTIPAHKHYCKAYGDNDLEKSTANMPKYLCVYAWKRTA